MLTGQTYAGHRPLHDDPEAARARTRCVDKPGRRPLGEMRLNHVVLKPGYPGVRVA